MAISGDEAALQGRALSLAASLKTRLLVAACLIAVMCMYWPTTLALSQLWLDTNKTTYTHGFIVLAISLWLILRDERLEQIQDGKADLGALALYGFSSFGW